MSEYNSANFLDYDIDLYQPPPPKPVVRGGSPLDYTLCQAAAETSAVGLHIEGSHCAILDNHREPASCTTL